MGGRAVWIWDARMLGEALEKKGEVEPWQKRESSLKFMTRAVRCMPNDDGALPFHFSLYASCSKGMG